MNRRELMGTAAAALAVAPASASAVAVEQRWKPLSHYRAEMVNPRNLWLFPPQVSDEEVLFLRTEDGRLFRGVLGSHLTMVTPPDQVFTRLQFECTKRWMEDDRNIAYPGCSYSFADSLKRSERLKKRYGVVL